MRQMICMNEMGDTTIAWDEDSDNMMRGLIQKKMDEGFTFFIVKPRLGGIIRPKRTKLKKVGDLKDNRAVSVADQDFAAIISSGHVSTMKKPEGEIETVGRAKTAEQASKASTVAVSPRRGG